MTKNMADPSNMGHPVDNMALPRYEAGMSMVLDPVGKDHATWATAAAPTANNAAPNAETTSKPNDNISATANAVSTPCCTEA